MTLSEILNIAIIVVCALTYGVMLYFKVKGNVFGAVSELIALAETTGLAGTEKMAQVVSQLYGRIPAVFKKILTEQTLHKIAQKIFDWMRKYADEYMKTYADSIESNTAMTIEDVKEIGTALTTDVLNELMEMTVDQLRDKAAEYGIIIDSTETSKEIFADIVQSLVKKA